MGVNKLKRAGYVSGGKKDEFNPLYLHLFSTSCFYRLSLESYINKCRVGIGELNCDRS